MSIKEISCENASSGKGPFVSSWNTALNYQSALKRGIYCNIRGCPGGDYYYYHLLECATVEIINVSEESTASTLQFLYQATILYVHNW